MASASFKNGSLIESYTSTATSGSTLTLTSSSDAYQLLTGTQNHTVKLPDATTMISNQRFEVINASTGIITVQNNGSVTQGTLAAGETKIFRVTDITSANGVFDVTTTPSGGTGGLSTTESGEFQSLSALGFSATSKLFKASIEEVGGNYWTNKASLPVAKASDAFTLNGYSFSVGGFTTAEVNTSYRYNDDNNYWLTRNNITVAKYDAATFVLNGFGYHVAGQTNAAGSGITSNNSYKYTDSTDTWTAITDINTPCRSSGAGQFDLGYVLGGYNGSLPASNKVQSYNPTSNAWIIYSITLPSTVYLPASFSNKEFIYTAGGSNGSITISSTYAWNSIFNFVTTKFSMSAVRQTSGASALGFGLAMGGYNGSYISTGEKYYFDYDIWLSIANRNNAFQNSPCGATTLNGTAYIFGAYGPSASAVVESFTPFSMFSVGTLSNSSLTPSSINIAVILNALSSNVPVQLRTDGDSWKNFVSGGAAIKTSETLSTKFQPAGLPYISGGFNGSSIANATYYYNALTNVYVTRANLLTARQEASGGSVNGFGYTFGGQTSGGLTTSGEKYNDTTNVYSATTAVMPNAGTQDSEGDTLNGFIYIVGGQAPGPRLNTNYQYNPTADSFATKQVVNQDARLGGAVMSISGLILAAGGLPASGTAAINTSETYSDVTNTWTNRGNLSTGVYYGYGSQVGGFGYIAGGNTTAPLGSGTNFVSTVQKFDPVAFTWSTVASISQAVVGINAMRQSGLFYRFGGVTSSDQTTSQVYSPLLNSWASITSLPAAATYGTCNFMPGAFRSYEVRVGIPAFYAGLGGLVWNLTTGILPTSANACGGSGMSIQGFGYMAGTVSPATTTVQKYNESSNSAINYISMNVARYNAGAFSLHGIGYVFHGVGNPSSTLTSAEKIDVTTNTWTNLTNPGITGGNDTGQGACLNGFGYILGGDIGVATSQWNDSTSAWTTKTNNPSASLYARCSVNGYIYSISGTSTYKYNDGANTWSSSVATLSTSPSDPSFLVYNNAAISVTSGATEKLNDATLVWYRVQAPSQSTDGSGFFTLSNGFALGRSVDCFKLADSVKQAVLSAGLTVS